MLVGAGPVLGLLEEAMLDPIVKVKDAVCVMVKEELRLDSNEEIRDVDWVDSAVMEIKATDEADTSVLCPKVFDESMIAELLETVTELLYQSVVIVDHGAKEDSIDRVQDQIELGIQVESQLVTWLVFGGGRHGSKPIFMFPLSFTLIGGSGQAGIDC